MSNDLPKRTALLLFALVVSAALVLNEPITLPLLCAMALIVAGIALGTMPRRRGPAG